MTQKANIFAAVTVIAAVLILLLHPATPGVVAPNGGKIMKVLLTLALNVWAPLIVAAALTPQIWVRARQTAPADVEFSFRTTTLLC